MWMEDCVKDETPLSLKRHIVRHAKEIYEGDNAGWVASMRNLLDKFEIISNVYATDDKRLERLLMKWHKNKRRYTPPPDLARLK